MNWYGAYFEPQRFTAGYDCWITAQKADSNGAEAELSIEGNAADQTTLLYVAGSGDWCAEYNGQAVDCVMGVEGCLEITLPKASSGKLVIKRK